MTILAIDFMNQCHRARSGFLAGDFPVVYNFFRGFRALVQQFNPTRIYVALEGKPIERYQTLEAYKANRKVSADDPRAAELTKFFSQKDLIQDLLSNYFPVSVVRHPHFEADDTISNLVKNATTAVDWTIVSSDTDFIQLLHDRPNVKLYNPVKKEYVEPPADYDYVTWKSLRGDSSDNIPGIPGVGDKTADKIASDPVALREFITRADVAPIFTRNYELIKFADWSHDEAMNMTSSSPVRDWSAVKSKFEEMQFASMTKDPSWQKFIDTFDHLFG